MTDPVFDAAGYIKFDLDTGTIRSADDQGLAVVPLDLIASLQPGDALGQASRKWGEAAGEKLAVLSLESDEPLGPEALAEHLAGSLAMAGFGRARVNIRSGALLLELETQCEKEARPGLVAVVGGYLSGYFSSMISPDVFEAIAIEEGDDTITFWAGNPIAVEKVRGMIDEGASPLEALDRLAREGATR